MMSYGSHFRLLEKKMGWKGLEREPLDYILTDLLPVELSDRFSFYPLYEFLLKKENRKILNSLTKEFRESKAQGAQKIFDKGWATQPLKYKIIKGIDTYREMSLIQPFSALNIYFFIQCYQKEILQYLKKNHVYSIRYHKNNSELSYKESDKKSIKYFLKSSQTLKKLVIQQAGNYFKIVPFASLNGFTDSQAWRLCNFKFKLFAKIDYKSCFDSIYSHVYNYIIERDMIDAKDADNPNLFIEIDRIIQNINGKSSNGLIVGPEFSRLIAEVLLQHIDSDVFIELEKKGLSNKKDYRVFRYVDDIFIFANESTLLNTIVNTFQSVANQHRLAINELKMTQEQTPCLPKDWLEKTRLISDSISELFFQGKFEEFQQLPPEQRHFVIKSNTIERIKDEITVLMKTFSTERRSIVSFLLSTILNKISQRVRGYTLFKPKNRLRQAIPIIDLALFIYAFFPAFEQTDKVISILTYVNEEVDFRGLKEKDNGEKLNKINRLFQKYSFIFQMGNLHDLCNWFPFFYENGVQLPVVCEDLIFSKAEELNDPIILGNLLIYSQYNENLMQLWTNKINNIITKNIEQINSENLVESSEFWFVLIFFNCPFIDANIKLQLKDMIDEFHQFWIKKSQPNARLHQLLCQFLLTSKDGFFDWSEVKKFGQRIVYRTYKRTFFKRYKKRSYGLYASI